MPDKIIKHILMSYVNQVGMEDNIEAAFIYVPADPYAVSVKFSAEDIEGGIEVIWSFARQLLVDGQRRRAGWGDVEVSPMPHKFAWLTLRLSNTNGKAVFGVRQADIKGFLYATQRAVPLGGEPDIALHDLDLYLAENVYFAI